MNSTTKTFDIAILDSTPAGIAAAVAAGRAGMNVVIVTEDQHVGGLQTSGLGWTNAGVRETVGGLAKQFHSELLNYYETTFGPSSKQAADCDDGFRFESHVAEQLFERWLRDANVTVIREFILVGVEKVQNQISRAHFESTLDARKLAITAKVFIDASYEGDLLAMAGCSHHIGRESSAQYGESLAGIRFPPEVLGKADSALQPCDYRLCLTNDVGNRVPFSKPADYDASRYAWHAAKIAAEQPHLMQQLLPLNPMPNSKTDSRTGEWVGGADTYPTASPAERKRLDAAHKNYSAGYIWFLLHDPAVPKQFRDELSHWGHAADEFIDNDHWPYHLYIREARRLVGDFVLTQQDVQDKRFADDAIALGSFYLDVHPVRMVEHETGFAGLVDEGSLKLANGRPTPLKPYEIPYRVLLPKREEAANLLVPICVSASHVGFSTIRMEPVYQMLGHAAGLAAKQCVTDGIAVQDVNVEQLQDELTADGAALSAEPFTEYWPWDPM